jgi:hypothetical protein
VLHNEYTTEGGARVERDFAMILSFLNILSTVNNDRSLNPFVRPN